ncbi:MAG: PDZ domain-containing protein [Verrucomicrobia bacterium]|nr:MAG: PDZ domain-containing protein [Verrucomicrobiota bacterium]
MITDKKKGGNFPLFLLFLLALSIGIGLLAFWRIMHPVIPQATVTSLRSPFSFSSGERNQNLSSPALRTMDNEFTELVEHVIPSVVSITTTTALDREALVRQFFGLGGGGGVPKTSKMGSGMIVSSDGQIVTNWHVINGASQIAVQMSDGRTLPARVAGVDQRSDIAVLKVDAENLMPIELGDSEQVKVGQMVFAVGNPFGLQETVTQGIISAKGRRTTSEAANEFFQTSATINPGNSGGPLIDIHGKVIGINNFILSSSGGSEGIGFSIPSNVARRVYEDVVQHGRVIHPWLGVVMRPLTPGLAKQLLLSNTQGALVAATLPNSPAEKAGLQSGDVILAIDGRAVRDGKDLRNRVAEAPVGKRVTLSILRAGQAMELSTRMDEEPPN